MGAFLVSVAGFKKSGKTTVACSLIAELSARGYRVAALKRSHLRRLSLDPRGTDSRRLLDAGALFVAARAREQTLTVLCGEQPADLQDLLAQAPASAQFVVLEGSPGGLPAAVVLCLREAEQLEETLRARGLNPGALIALSGLFAADPQAAADLRAPAAAGAGGLPPVFNVLEPAQRRALCERVLAAAGGPRPAGAPSGPLAQDPSWRPE